MFPMILKTLAHVNFGITAAVTAQYNRTNRQRGNMIPRPAVLWRCTQRRLAVRQCAADVRSPRVVPSHGGLTVRGKHLVMLVRARREIESCTCGQTRPRIPFVVKG